MAVKPIEMYEHEIHAFSPLINRAYTLNCGSGTCAWQKFHPGAKVVCFLISEAVLERVLDRKECIRRTRGSVKTVATGM